MKLWEVLKELEENPKKRFKSIKRMSDVESVLWIGSNDYLYLERKKLDGTKLPVDKSSGGFNGNINIYADWQEVKQPVTWQEAIEAWMNGKTIGVTQKDIEKRFYEGKDYLLRDQHGDSVSEDEIAEGTWYIEED